MSGVSVGPHGMGYRANCRCKDAGCRQTLTVYPDDAVIQFVDQRGQVHIFHLGQEEANALAMDLGNVAKE